MDIEAIVTRSEQDHVFVKVNEKPGGCGRCHESGGCSSGALTQIFRRHGCREFRLRNDIGARVGDKVKVSLADGVTLQASLVVYLLPVLCILVGAWIGTWLAGESGSDALATTGAIAGFLLSLVLVALYRRRHAANVLAQPVLSRIDSRGDACLHR